MGNTPGIAIAALILGICALLLGWIPILGWLIALTAIILGIVALIKVNHENLDGKGMAITGLVLGIVGGVFGIIISFGALAYFGVLSPQKMLPERCIGPAGLDCIDKVEYDGEHATWAVKNNLGYDIVFVSMDVQSGACTELTLVEWKTGGYFTSNSLVVKNGEFASFKVGCPGADKHLLANFELTYNAVETGVEGKAIYTIVAETS